MGLEHIEPHTMRLLGTSPAAELRSQCSEFQSGDILYGRMRPYLNKVYAPTFGGLCSGEFIVLRSTGAIEERYLAFYLNRAAFVSFATSVTTGDRPRIRFEQMADAVVPLPPLAEQCRIVAELEKQLSRLDAGIAALKRAHANLRRYRASVLKAAFEGRLVPQDPNDEPAKAAVQSDDGPKTDGLSLFPNTWKWVRAADLCGHITKGTTPTASLMFSGSGAVPFVKVYNLTNRGLLDFSVKPTFVDVETHEGLLGRSRVFPGDVLMNIVGPPLGKVAVVPANRPVWNVNQAIAILRPQQNLNARFLTYWLLSDAASKWMWARAKTTAGQANLTLETCRAIPVPLAPIEEQRRIVLELDARLSVLDTLESSTDRNYLKSTRLRQSILKRAFEGKLVPQDPSDEPASALLARIRAERETVEPQAARRVGRPSRRVEA